jgi:hypothetical protein
LRSPFRGIRLVRSARDRPWHCVPCDASPISLRQQFRPALQLPVRPPPTSDCCQTPGRRTLSRQSRLCILVKMGVRGQWFEESGLRVGVRSHRTNCIGEGGTLWRDVAHGGTASYCGEPRRVSSAAEAIRGMGGGRRAETMIAFAVVTPPAISRKASAYLPRVVLRPSECRPSACAW